jgi:DNA-binding NarL/FixJ family response regulator
MVVMAIDIEVAECGTFSVLIRRANAEQVCDVTSTRVLIADDHPMVRRALSEALLESFGASFEVLEAGSVASAREAMSNNGVDLLLLDLYMPGMEGALSLNALRADFPSVPILVVSAIEDPSIVRQTMEFGASGFLPKSAPFSAISDAVRSVLAGDLWFPEFDTETEHADGQMAARIAELTPQQRRVFVLVCQGKLNKEIAFELDVTEATVKAHVSQILHKLGVHSRTQAALVAQRLNKPGSHTPDPKR